MSAALRAAGSTDIGNPALNIAIFGVFVLITLAIVSVFERAPLMRPPSLRGDPSKNHW